jgi:hypothetical protein
MTSFTYKLSTSIIDSVGYRKASNTLFESYVCNLMGEHKPIDRADIKKLISSAQIFYKSENDRLRNEGAIVLSMILELCAKDHPDIVPIANSIFANFGDFPNISLLSKRFPDLEFRYSFYSEAQIDFRMTLNTVGELDFPLTDYQRSLWDNLTSNKDVITSAPTSAGKTHIILNYLLSKMADSDGSFAAVVVPTRALISEVAAKIYELSKNWDHEEKIEICTVPREGEFGAKTFFVMTQERLHELLLRGDIYFDYLFIDEAHNIADKSRGVLLHLTVERMLEDSLPQIIISMPSANYQNSFSTIFKGYEFTKKITQHSPVSKIIMSVIPKGRNLIISRLGSKNVQQVPKNFKGKDLADIVFKLGKGESNIIYRNKTNYCEDFANEISDRITNLNSNPLLAEAADYVEKFIHSKFSLADNLRKGVAFHYGPLPSSIRIMIENLAKDDQIKFIVCTSTLAEGINLPAKNLFLKNPSQPIPLKPSERIENVKINNITGRAGRMLQHFSGNIFLIEPDDWQFKDYFDEATDEEEKIPTYFKSLNDELPNILKALRGSTPHDEQDQYRFYSIANKLIKDFANNKLDASLQAKELILSEDDLQLLKANVRLAFNALKVAAFTLEANPTVGYIQQNKLFTFLEKQTDFDEWILPHPKSNELYDRLLKVCYKLHECGVYIPTENYTLEHICVITKKWIQGNNLKEIILEQIDWDSRHNKQSSINTCVRDVIKAINNDIRFRLANAFRCYQVLLDNVLISKDINLTNVKLHSFIEIGASDERIVNLINFGLSREAAIEIDQKLSKKLHINSPVDLLDLLNKGMLQAIHPVTQKELQALLS